MINIVLADDHEIVRNGIKMLLESESDIQVIGEASDGKEAIEALKNYKPDVLVMDISMPEMDGLTATQELINYNPSTRILILSMHEKEEYVLKAVNIGAYGYILKDAPKHEFIKAIKTVAMGEKFFSSDISHYIVNNYLNTKQDGGNISMPSFGVKNSDPEKDSFNQLDYNNSQQKEAVKLTRKEKEILLLLIEGNNNKQIAEKNNISIRTIETHRFNIMKKMNVNNAVEMVRVAIQDKLV